MGYDDFFNSGRNTRGKNKPDFYEDTHNEKGEFIGSKEKEVNTFINPQSNGLLKDTDYIAPRQYQSVVVYAPRSPEDVQNLIDFLRRREPAIINLDNAETADAQRILDFVSGAIYALNGSVHRIASNIFLLSPEGVEITIPYEQP